MKITAIVLNWNGKNYISACLDSLIQIDRGPHQLELVVVDNDSTDGSLEFIKSKYPQFTLLRNPTNLGYAAGNNTGLRYALDNGSDFAWVINSDILVTKDSLLRFIEEAVQHVRDGIFGCKIYFAPGFETHKDRYQPKDLGRVIWYGGGIIDWGNVYASHRAVDEVDIGQCDRNFEIDFVTGACMFIKRSVLEEVGLFDPKYFLYLEETDLCQRARQSRFRLMFLYRPVAWHANAQAAGLGSSLQDYFLTRNRLLFGSRYARAYIKLLLIKDSLHIYRTGRPWQRRAVMDFYTGRFGAGSYQPE